METVYQGFIAPDDYERLQCAMVRQYGLNGAIAPRVMLSRFAQQKQLTVKRCLAMVIHHEKQLEGTWQQ